MIAEHGLNCDYERSGFLQGGDLAALCRAHPRRDRAVRGAGHRGLQVARRRRAGCSACARRPSSAAASEPGCGAAQPAQMGRCAAPVSQSARARSSTRSTRVDDVRARAASFRLATDGGDGDGRQGRVRHQRLHAPDSRHALQADAGLRLHRRHRAAERPSSAPPSAGQGAKASRTGATSCTSIG